MYFDHIPPLTIFSFLSFSPPTTTAFYLLSCSYELGWWVTCLSKGFSNEVCDSSLSQLPLTAYALQEGLRAFHYLEDIVESFEHRIGGWRDES